VLLTFTGLFGPAKMAPELVARLHAALQPMFANATIKEKLLAQGMTLWPTTGQQLAQSLVEEHKRFEGLVKASGYVAEAS
jgi:tripartite-type tricarboxylate transporter receptor subunit TctC